MKVIHSYEDVGPDRMLHIRVPEDIPEGRVEMFMVVEPCPVPTPEQRRAAVKALRGSMKHLGITVDEFLAERRADEERRERVLREAAGE
ncbi:MAG: hypothetical protein HY689_07190 [Chloroflexi bacterium]|nr:hypothetical protein [Chloroflexota bacterium]